MSKRTSVLGIAAAAALGVAALTSAAPATAQGWGAPHGRPDRGATERGIEPAEWGDRWGGHSDGHWGGHGGWRHSRGWSDHGGQRWGGHDGWRHRNSYYGGPVCHVQKVRYWDGWNWVIERRRTCR